MQVFALVGSSGTGKSHRASYLAFKHNIDLIIDDGLLIQGNSILAGKSAKREATRFGAVKRAIFHDQEHAAEVKKKISESGAENILILGTSEKMTKRIATKLELPPPQEVIRIEEIASPRAIDRALEERKKKNSHVIPIPTFAIKKDFPGYLIDPLRSFWGKSNREDEKKLIIERSIVRPIFNSFGTFFISEQAIVQMTTHIASQITGVARVIKVDVISRQDGVTLDIDVNIYYGDNVPSVLRNIQTAIKETIEFLTGLNLVSIQVTARRIELGSGLNN
ncbi:MAG: Asp23/Gls24 family envelope stress response protein [Dethiobacter sp.]|jgi:uncharacterized alkaline shock family protein YloU/adenylate kinase family enzyme|nr:Asp23/Gls24 family envelope stress response protein [Dethiobacter sp.]